VANVPSLHAEFTRDLNDEPKFVALSFA
jgi:hypothetical protein